MADLAMLLQLGTNTELLPVRVDFIESVEVTESVQPVSADQTRAGAVRLSNDFGSKRTVQVTYRRLTAAQVEVIRNLRETVTPIVVVPYPNTDPLNAFVAVITDATTIEDTAAVNYRSGQNITIICTEI